MSNRDETKATLSVAQMVDEVHAALVGDTGIPAAVQSLSPKEFLSLLGGVGKRLEKTTRTETATVCKAPLDELLTLDRYNNKVKAVADIYGLSIALARRVLGDGSIAKRLLTQALEVIPPGVGEIEVLYKRLGKPAWTLISEITAEWARAESGSRTSSAASGALARLLALHLSRKECRDCTHFTADVAGELLRSLPIVRLKDQSGSVDPLLVGLVPALEDLLQSRSPPGCRPQTAPPPAAPEPPEALRGAIEAIEGVLKQWAVDAVRQEQLKALPAEVQRLQSELRQATEGANSLRDAGSRLKERLDALGIEKALLEQQLAGAMRDVEDWKSEAKRDANDALARAHDEIERSKDQMRTVLERFGVPALELAERQAPEADGMDQIKINLRNLLDKLQRLTVRRGDGHELAAPTVDTASRKL
jgi:hypothetical protein